MTFRLDGSAADEHDGADGVVVLLLFESSAETVHTGITVLAKKAGIVGDGFPVGVYGNRRRGPLGQNSPHFGFH